jgi:hypothetical protein
MNSSPTVKCSSKKRICSSSSPEAVAFRRFLERARAQDGVAVRRRGISREQIPHTSLQPLLPNGDRAAPAERARSFNVSPVRGAGAVVDADDPPLRTGALDDAATRRAIMAATVDVMKSAFEIRPQLSRHTAEDPSVRAQVQAVYSP